MSQDTTNSHPATGSKWGAGMLDMAAPAEGELSITTMYSVTWVTDHRQWTLTL